MAKSRAFQVGSRGLTRRYVGIIAAIMVLFLAVAALVIGSDPLFPLEAVKVPRPGGRDGSAVFLVDSGSVRFNDISFFVRDPRARTAARRGPVWIGGPYCRDGRIEMRDAVWTKDGSVVAVRGVARNVSATDVVFVDAYDFDQHQAVLPEDKNDVHADLNSNAVRRKDRTIADLVKKRGGVGASPIPYPGGGSQEPLDWWEARQYVRALP